MINKLLSKKCPYCESTHFTYDQDKKGRFIRFLYQCNFCRKIWGETWSVEEFNRNGG